MSTVRWISARPPRWSSCACGAAEARHYQTIHGYLQRLCGRCWQRQWRDLIAEMTGTREDTPA